MGVAVRRVRGSRGVMDPREFFRRERGRRDLSQSKGMVDCSGDERRLGEDLVKSELVRDVAIFEEGRGGVKEIFAGLSESRGIYRGEGRVVWVLLSGSGASGWCQES